VQGGGGVEAELAPHAVGDQRVDPAPSSTSLKWGSGVAGVELRAGRGVGHRRAVAVVEQALDEVGGGQQVLEPLLVLDADGVAAEVVRHAHGGDVHRALLQHLGLGELGRLVAAEVEGQPLASSQS
jgi:hypothetical protein